jgi:GMP synthase-like glutamine amidotransferase
LKPIAIFQHASNVGPGYFAQWLATHGLPFEVYATYEATPLPATSEAFSGLCFMGGPMSVNDPMPSIDHELALIRDADARGVPIIGHCLGGQLLAKALGARVARQAVKEIGWSDVAITDAELAARWLGPDAPKSVAMFQWHEDAFELPAGARNFMATPYCAHQAYVIERTGYAHLGMQFHCEMTPELVRGWAFDPEWNSALEWLARRGEPVQIPAQMVEALEARTTAMNAWAARLYARWSEGLRKN